MTMFEYTPSGTSRMTRRKLFDGVAMSSLALSSVGTVVASAKAVPGLFESVGFPAGSE